MVLLGVAAGCGPGTDRPPPPNNEVPSTLCGNGTLDEDETCDDGFADACGTCNEDCTGAGTGAGLCGDNSFCPEFEACDDGYTDACGSCNADCTGAGTGSTCGDGERCPEHETCDDGFTDTCGSCNEDCSGAGTGAAVCGDGERCEETEACDDGYTDACGSCNADCSGPGAGATCGDSVVCPELEACDDGYADACGTCNATCSGAGTVAVCGDGSHCPEFEACDDGYEDACGTCNVDCSGPGTGSTCGDSIICPELEACDDGYEDDCGTCNATCTDEGTGATCGDGAFCEELEACDDGFTDECGSCNEDCSDVGGGNECGDGIACAEFEPCDDGNTVDGDYCSSDCSEVTGACGDGIVQMIEVCDDGDEFEDNLCSQECQIARFACTAERLDEVPAAGDGLLLPDTEDFVPLCDGWVLLGDKDDNTILVYNHLIDLTMFEFPLVAAPTLMAFDYTSGLLYVAMESSTELSIVHVPAQTVSTVELGASIKGIAVADPGNAFVTLDDAATAPSREVVWVSGLGAGVIDSWLGVGWEPMIAYDNASTRLFLASEDGSLRRLLFEEDPEDVFDLVEDELIFGAGTGCRQLTVSPGGGRVALTCSEGNGIGYTIFDFAGGELTTVNGEWATGAFPGAGQFSIGGGRLAATNGADLFVFNSGTHLKEIKEPVNLSDCQFNEALDVGFSAGDGLAYGLFRCGLAGDSAKLFWLPTGL